jgi:hypothetical protein
MDGACSKKHGEKNVKTWLKNIMEEHNGVSVYKNII